MSVSSPLATVTTLLTSSNCGGGVQVLNTCTEQPQIQRLKVILCVSQAKEKVFEFAIKEKERSEKKRKV